jgi:hypothetical protein
VVAGSIVGTGAALVVRNQIETADMVTYKTDSVMVRNGGASDTEVSSGFRDIQFTIHLLIGNVTLPIPGTLLIVRPHRTFRFSATDKARTSHYTGELWQISILAADIETTLR